MAEVSFHSAALIKEVLLGQKGENYCQYLFLGGVVLTTYLLIVKASSY